MQASCQPCSRVVVHDEHVVGKNLARPLACSRQQAFLWGFFGQFNADIQLIYTSLAALIFLTLAAALYSE